MILTTTPSVEGRSIEEYRGIVFGEVISGVDVIKDFTAGLSNFFGGRSATCLLYTSPSHETGRNLVCRLLLEKKKNK